MRGKALLHGAVSPLPIELNKEQWGNGVVGRGQILTTKDLEDTDWRRYLDDSGFIDFMQHNPDYSREQQWTTGAFLFGVPVGALIRL